MTREGGSEMNKTLRCVAASTRGRCRGCGLEDVCIAFCEETEGERDTRGRVWGASTKVKKADAL